MDSFSIYILLALFFVAVLFYIYWETIFVWKENLKQFLRERMWQYVNLSEQKDGVLSTSTDSPLQAIAHYIDSHFLLPSEYPIPIDEEYLEQFDNNEEEDENFENEEEEGFENEDEEGFENEEEEEN